MNQQREPTNAVTTVRESFIKCARCFNLTNPSFKFCPVCGADVVGKRPRQPRKSATSGVKPKVAGEVWLAERKRRNCVNVIEACRGCIALAALIDVNDLHFDIPVSDTAVMWSIMRDIRVGHFHPTREAVLVNTTRTTLKFGMPFIDFSNATEQADFNICPVSDDAELLGIEPPGDVLRAKDDNRIVDVFNTMNAKMTDFAMTATDQHGKPWRPAWFRANYDKVKPTPASPQDWMPVPYLQFKALQADHLFKAANLAKVKDTAYECKGCGSFVRKEMFKRFKDLGYQVFEEHGYFSAKCPICYKPSRWYATDEIPEMSSREFPIAFQERFLAAMSRGLTVTAVGETVYGGRLPFDRMRDFPNLDTAELRSLDLVPHRLINKLDGEVELVYLPPSAKVIVKQGTVLSQGEPWARILEPTGPRLVTLERPDAWRTLPETLEASGLPRSYLSLLQERFFECRARRYADHPDSIFFPTDLMAVAARSVKSTGLFWDFSAAEKYFDKCESAFIFPPIPQQKWNAFSFTLPHDVVVNAEVKDPRYRATLPITHIFKRALGPKPVPSKPSRFKAIYAAMAKLVSKCVA